YIYRLKRLNYGNGNVGKGVDSMSKYIAVALLIVLTIAIGVSSINGSGDGTVKGSLTKLLGTSSSQITSLESDLK
ncbi:MAG: hypothetical protein PHE79_11225, partial [Eubacteriales bacterium]|nr:hypothetical protein [Eubacteriales bacterium]